MRHVTAITTMVLVACLCLAGAGNAQTPQALQIQGILQSVDCQTGQVTLATAGGNDSFQATGQTVAYVNGAAVSLCTLQSYAGDSATAVLVPAGNALDLSQISVTAAQAAPSTSGSLLSNPVAVGIGALLLGGIIGYVVGHNSAPAPAPAFLPPTYPYNHAYRYQGHDYYRCTDGWHMDQACHVSDGPGEGHPQ